MTRVIFTADHHFGDLAHSRPDPVTGIPSSLLSVDRCWRYVVELAQERGADAVIVGGDVFHTRNPGAVALGLFTRGLNSLTDAGIPVVLLAGNHDMSTHPHQDCILDAFRGRPLVYVSTRPEVLHLPDLTVATLPTVDPSWLRAKHPGLSKAEGKEAMTEALLQVLGMLRAEAPVGSVLALHWACQGSIGGAERDLSLIVNEPVLPLSELDPWGPRVLAGHIHHAQELRTQTLPVRVLGHYSGSIDRRTFGEESDEKYVLEIDLGSDSTEITRHPMPARRFLTIDVTDPDTSWVDGMDVEGAIVRVRFSCRADELPRWDQSGISRRLYAAGAHLVHVLPDIKREATRRAEAVTEELSLEELQEAWLQLQQVPEEERSALRETAKSIEEAMA